MQGPHSQNPSKDADEPGICSGSGPIISIRHASYTYPAGVQALRDVNIDIERGEVVSVVGPSGCGKSTLLQMIAGFAVPSGGCIDRPVTADSHRHPVAMVFQKDTVLPWLTVEKNVGLVHRFAGRKARAREKDWISYLLEVGGLSDFRSAYPYQLSGGMRRRVAFLSSVAARPEILLLDEPFSALDEPTRVGIHQSIYEIIAELGITAVLVTHDLNEAISLSDEVVLLTKRPGTVASRHRVSFGSERIMLDLRAKPEFLALYGDLWHNLSEQIRSSDAQGSEAETDE